MTGQVHGFQINNWKNKFIHKFPKLNVALPGLKITAGRRTMSGQDDHLSEQTFS